MKRTIIWSGAVLAAAVLATSGLLAGGHSGGERGRRDGRMPTVMNAQWDAECGACHLAFPPGFLPARSWQAVMRDLEHHFGDNAALDPAVGADIERFLAANAADRNGGRRGTKIAASIPPDAAPLRITATRWFAAKHDEIEPVVWKRPSIGSAANCAACHRRAAMGEFAERDVAIPRAAAPVAGVRASAAQ